MEEAQAYASLMRRMATPGQGVPPSASAQPVTPLRLLQLRRVQDHVLSAA